MKQHDDVRDSLLFAGMSQSEITKFLTTFANSLNLQQGEFLWHRGETGDSMYLLESGQLQVIIESDKVLTTIDQGAVIGEICVFGHEDKRTASIRAVEESTLLLIEGDKFRQLVEQRDPGVLLVSYNIAKLLCQRIVLANEFIRKVQQMAEKPQIKSEVQHFRERFFEDSLFN